MSLKYIKHGVKIDKNLAKVITKVIDIVINKINNDNTIEELVKKMLEHINNLIFNDSTSKDSLIEMFDEMFDDNKNVNNYFKLLLDIKYLIKTKKDHLLFDKIYLHFQNYVKFYEIMKSLKICLLIAERENEKSKIKISQRDIIIVMLFKESIDINENEDGVLRIFGDIEPEYMDEAIKISNNINKLNLASEHNQFSIAACSMLIMAENNNIVSFFDDKIMNHSIMENSNANNNFNNSFSYFIKLWSRSQHGVIDSR